MAPYVISYLGPLGETQDRTLDWFESDDHAIDSVGRSDHPHEILVHQGARLVARFPPK